MINPTTQQRTQEWRRKKETAKAAKAAKAAAKAAKAAAAETPDPKFITPIKNDGLADLAPAIYRPRHFPRTSGTKWTPGKTTRRKLDYDDYVYDCDDKDEAGDEAGNEAGDEAGDEA
jgi:hypothetical protein